MRQIRKRTGLGPTTDPDIPSSAYVNNVVQFLNSQDKKIMRNISVCLLIILTGISVFGRYAEITYPDKTESSRIHSPGKYREMIRQNQTAFTAIIKTATRLFRDKDDLTSVILVIPTGKEVAVLGADSTYLRVVYEEAEGFILKRHAEISQTPLSSRTSIMPYATDDQAEIRSVPQPGSRTQTQPPEQSAAPSREAGSQVQTESQARRKERYNYLEKKYGSSMARKLIAGKIWKGMAREMIMDSWGKPLKINRIISGNSTKEEWVYRNTWLYVKDDVLLTWGPVRK